MALTKEQIEQAVRSILHQDIDFRIELFKHEDGEDFYKNIYKIVSINQQYVFKEVKDRELNVYKFLNNSFDLFPRLYGSYRFYSDYILIEYVDGKNANKLDRNILKMIIDSIIKIQKSYWGLKSEIGVSKEKAVTRIEERFKYLPDEFKPTYQMFIDCFKKTPSTFSHEDLLPFNVLIKDGRVCFIDLEEVGILPYPKMLSRLIAFGEEKDDALFFLKKEDYNFAIEYYYDFFVKSKNISKDNYLKTMDLFIFNELIEWVYVYKHANIKPDDFYQKWYDKAYNKLKDINDK